MFTLWETVQRTGGGFLSGMGKWRHKFTLWGGEMPSLSTTQNFVYRHQPLGMLAQVANQQGKHLANSLNR